MKEKRAYTIDELDVGDHVISYYDGELAMIKECIHGCRYYANYCYDSDYDDNVEWLSVTDMEEAALTCCN